MLLDLAGAAAKPANLTALGVFSLLSAALLVAFVRRIGDVEQTAKRWLWIALVAALCGVLAWAGHVTTVLAVGEGHAATYDLARLAASLAIVVGTVAAGLFAASPKAGETDLVSAAVGGGLVGLSLLAAHYVGAGAIRVPGRVMVDDMTMALAGAGVVTVSAASFVLALTGLTVARRCAAALLMAAAFAAAGLASSGATAVTLNLRAPAAEAATFVTVALFVAAVTVAALAAAVAGLLLDGRLGGASSGSSERLQAFADLSAEGIVICEDGRIVDVNVAAARFLGLDPSVLRGRAFRDFVDAPDPDRVLSASFAKPQETVIKSMGGEPAFVEVSSRDLEVLGRTRRVFTLRDLSEVRRNENQIRHLAYHDPLTGLANRAAFNEALAAALKRGGEVALFCIDLDRFKEVNDVFGHSAGDDLLRTAARRIVAAAPDTMVFRLGGDEFVAIGTGPDAGDADKLALRLTERLNVETVVAGNTIRCGASVGYAVHPHHGSTTDALFANADAALYRAKADGRGLARGFAPEMDLALRERRALQQDLGAAISRNEMFLHWMPQANAATGEIVGFEALLRWKHPTRGVVPPVTFIPVAEETAAIVPIGEWVLRTACREAAGWVKPGKVAVNLSPVQFQHGDIVALVHGILFETGLSPARLELEITEGVLLDDLSGALQTLRRLKALGVQIAMDDFGTGYSSLSYLQAFPFDRIKIDASFIRTLSTSPQAKAIVRAVIALGASLDMPITAEGVETPEQRAFLADLHCEEIQGYLVGRPSPVVSFENPFDKPRIRAVG